MMRAGLALIMVLGLFSSARAQDKKTFYPDNVYAMIYSGWAETNRKRVEEKPLWHGVESGSARQIRFALTDGRFNKTRIIHIRERPDGTGTLHVFSLGAAPRKPTRMERRDVIKLDAGAMAAVNRLAVESGTFDFAAGSWDDMQEVYVHCQLLEMERADASGYRYSSINIGCNQPKKLMPFVEHVMALAKIKRRDPQLL